MYTTPTTDRIPTPAAVIRWLAEIDNQSPAQTATELAQAEQTYGVDVHNPGGSPKWQTVLSGLTRDEAEYWTRRTRQIERDTDGRATAQIVVDIPF